MRTTPEIPAFTDEIEFIELIDGYRRELQAHCMRMISSPDESEDLVQETMMRAWRGRRRFEGREGQASLRAWLYRIATNVCHDALRRRQRRPQVAPAADLGDEGDVGGWLERFESSRPGPADEVAAQESFESALEAVLRLPERQRAALVLRDVVGLSARETASLLGTSVPSVTSAVQRARANLRDRLEKERHEWASGQATSW